jgi:hypothetical protein
MAVDSAGCTPVAGGAQIDAAGDFGLRVYSVGSRAHRIVPVDVAVAGAQCVVTIGKPSTRPPPYRIDNRRAPLLGLLDHHGRSSRHTYGPSPCLRAPEHPGVAGWRAGAELTCRGLTRPGLMPAARAARAQVRARARALPAGRARRRRRLGRAGAGRRGGVCVGGAARAAPPGGAPGRLRRRLARRRRARVRPGCAAGARLKLAIDPWIMNSQKCQARLMVH